MSDKVDIKALAKLARLEVSEEELARLEKEIPAILKFVEQIQSADVSAVKTTQELRNVMRFDDNPIESGTFTQILLAAAPSRKGNRIAVKQVISRKK
jgi:aspartyl-tRNA(Asn)/glutamyl-tRNA(Gln) amidotransferase subunit C